MNKVKTFSELLAIAEFLGGDMSDAQSKRLMDAARELPIADRERLLDSLEGGALYTEMRMHDAEMGGLSMY